MTVIDIEHVIMCACREMIVFKSDNVGLGELIMPRVLLHLSSIMSKREYMYSAEDICMCFIEPQREGGCRG